MLHLASQGVVSLTSLPYTIKKLLNIFR